MKRRINLNYDGRSTTILMDIKKGEIYPAYDRKLCEDKLDAKYYYESHSGITGAGFCYADNNIQEISQYRTDCDETITKSALRLSTNSRLFVYAPIHKDVLDEEHPYIAVLRSYVYNTEYSLPEYKYQIIFKLTNSPYSIIRLIKFLYTLNIDELDEDDFEKLEEHFCKKKTITNKCYKIDYYGNEESSYTYYKFSDYYINTGRDTRFLDLRYLSTRNKECYDNEEQFNVVHSIGLFGQKEVLKYYETYFVTDVNNIPIKIWEYDPIYEMKKEDLSYIFRVEPEYIEVNEDKGEAYIALMKKEETNLLILKRARCFANSQIKEELPNNVYDYEISVPTMKFLVMDSNDIEALKIELKDGVQHKNRHDIKLIIDQLKYNKKIDELDDDIIITRQDSLDAGNCEPGTDRFIEKYFKDKTEVTAKELKQYRNNSYVSRVLKTIALKNTKQIS